MKTLYTIYINTGKEKYKFEREYSHEIAGLIHTFAPPDSFLQLEVAIGNEPWVYVGEEVRAFLKNVEANLVVPEKDERGYPPIGDPFADL